MNLSRVSITLRRAISHWQVRLFAVLLSPLLLSPALGAQAKAPANKAKSEPPAATATTDESVTAMSAIPRSEFKIPTSPAEGRDPFYPASTRIYDLNKETKPVTVPKPPAVVDLVLSGVSGSADKALAVINNVNFGVGDSLEVVSGKERVRVVCLEINVQAGTAVIEVNGVRRVLRRAESN
ncbi:MAG: hypothetical protein KIS67_26615 [Verrucomicrobiae bacterium]|nr:hypothetical protein [Verrucomicrobiae bacterium]